MTSTATDLTVAAWPDCAPRLLRPSQAGPEELRRLRARRWLPAARPMPMRCSSRSTCPDCSGAVARPSRSAPSCAPSATPAAAACRPSSSRTAKRANRHRSRTAGCCATDRTLCSTACAWPPRWSTRATRMCMCPTNSRPLRSPVRCPNSTAGAFGATDVTVLAVEPGYVAGEETAAVRRINGGPAKPTDKPPRPFEEGVSGLPTTVSNVETLANVPYIHEHGSQSYRAVGTPMSPGTFLATITGGGRPAALYEIPHGAAFSDLLVLHGLHRTRCAEF